MIPTHQKLMKPVLLCAAKGECKIGDVVETLADQFSLTAEERTQLRQNRSEPIFTDRVRWAKTYLLKAGLVDATGRGQFVITKRGEEVLKDDPVEISKLYLEQFSEFKEFQARKSGKEQDVIDQVGIEQVHDAAEDTPDEVLAKAHKEINSALESELLQRVRKVTPAFFEAMILKLLTAMGYGGTTEGSATPLGGAGDDGVDGVINQDALGVDQIYIQAKRYSEGSNVGPGPIREFSGALEQKKAKKGIFITTSAFSSSAVRTAEGPGSRIVLIDGVKLAKLMLEYNIGCRNERTLYLKEIDEGFFES